MAESTDSGGVLMELAILLVAAYVIYRLVVARLPSLPGNGTLPGIAGTGASGGVTGTLPNQLQAPPVQPQQQPAQGPPPMTPQQAPPLNPVDFNVPPPRDVAGNFNATMPDAFTQNDDGFTDGDGFRGLIGEQLWVPASRLRLDELTADDFADAWAFLSGGTTSGSGKFVRRDEIGTRGKNLLAEIAADQSGSLTAGIVGDIAKIIPIVGTALAAPYSSAQSTLGSDATGAAATLADNVRNQVSPATLSGNPIARAIMSADLDNGELALTPDELQTTIDIYAVDGNIGDRAKWVSSNGAGFQPRRRLFSRTRAGWLFPWLCYWFNGVPGGTAVSQRTGINRRARVYRAIDLLICMAFPRLPDRPHFTYPLWVYTHDKYGPIIGSIFPPDDINTAYGNSLRFYGVPAFDPRGNPIGVTDYFVDTKGQLGPVGGIYDWDGSPATNPATRAQERYFAKLGLDVNGVPLPGAVQTPIAPVVKSNPNQIEGGNSQFPATDPYGLIAAWKKNHNGADPPYSQIQQWVQEGKLPASDEDGYAPSPPTFVPPAQVVPDVFAGTPAPPHIAVVAVPLPPPPPLLPPVLPTVRQQRG